MSVMVRQRTESLIAFQQLVQANIKENTKTHYWSFGSETIGHWGIPSQRASDVENVFISRRHDGIQCIQRRRIEFPFITENSTSYIFEQPSFLLHPQHHNYIHWASSLSYCPFCAELPPDRRICREWFETLLLVHLMRTTPKEEQILHVTWLWWSTCDILTCNWLSWQVHCNTTRQKVIMIK